MYLFIYLTLYIITNGANSGEGAGEVLHLDDFLLGEGAIPGSLK